MIEQYFGFIEQFLAAYGLAAVFLFGVLEEILFFVPTPFVFAGVGFFRVDSGLKFWQALGASVLNVALPATIGIVAGGLVIYWLAYWGGRPLVRKLTKHIGIGWEDIENLQKRFRRGSIDEVALVLLRAIPIIPVGIVSMFCGLIRLPFQEFVWTTFAGTLMRITGLAMLGWYLGKGYVKYAEQAVEIERYLIIIILFAIFGGLVYLYGRSKNKK